MSTWYNVGGVRSLVGVDETVGWFSLHWTGDQKFGLQLLGR